MSLYASIVFGLMDPKFQKRMLEERDAQWKALVFQAKRDGTIEQWDPMKTPWKKVLVATAQSYETHLYRLFPVKPITGVKNPFMVSAEHCADSPNGMFRCAQVYMWPVAGLLSPRYRSKRDRLRCRCSRSH